MKRNNENVHEACQKHMGAGDRISNLKCHFHRPNEKYYCFSLYFWLLVSFLSVSYMYMYVHYMYKTRKALCTAIKCSQWRSYYGRKYSTFNNSGLQSMSFCHQRNAFITSGIPLALVDVHDVPFVSPYFPKDRRIFK